MDIEEDLRTKDYAIESSMNAVGFIDLDANLTRVNDSFLRFN